jgi:predicted helicase
MQHYLKGENIGLMVCRQQRTDGFYHCLIHNNIIESSFVSNKTSEIGYSFPLYLYSGTDRLLGDKGRKPNLKETIVNRISQNIGLKFVPEKSDDKKKFAPIDILDYIYAVLHCPVYRERYKEFLKIDFPRVPYPKDAERFWELVKQGEKLRCLHLLEGVEPRQGLAVYDVPGSHVVEKLEYKGERVWINETQFFDHVPVEVWNFYIGGYQPAQKWLKDRRGQQLNYDDIKHYQKIILVLKETREVMDEITALSE